MKIKTVVSAVMALSLLTSGFAFAQDHDHDRGHGDPHGHSGPANNHRDDHHDERGAGPNHAFHRGDRLPAEYRNRQYVVNDWRGHHLSAPPRGYHWVQTGGDYVLVAISTGVILNLLLGN
jgi:Ni/Co efflux regulator RcnB